MSVSLTNTVTGSTVVCGILFKPARTFSSITDGSVSGTLISSEQTYGNHKIRLYYWENITGEATDTYTFTHDLSGDERIIACVELKNVQTSSVLDTSGGNSGDTSSPFGSPNPSITPGNAATALVGWSGIDDSAGGTITPSTGWTVRQEFDGSLGVPCVLQTRIVTTSSAYTLNYTRSGTNGTSDLIAAFKD